MTLPCSLPSRHHVHEAVGRSAYPAVPSIRPECTGPSICSVLTLRLVSPFRERFDRCSGDCRGWGELIAHYHPCTATSCLKFRDAPIPCCRPYQQPSQPEAVPV